MDLFINDVSKIFPNTDATVTKALDSINLEIKEGEFVSIVGASGSGKSTLLRIIAGLTPPTTGQVILDKKEVNGPDSKIGMAFQRPTLFPWLTVEDNIKFGPKVLGKLKHKQMPVQEMIDTIGLSGFEKVYPHQLSGGMEQRVSLARAIYNDPEIMLLDEPLGALDAFTRLRLQAELLSIWEENNITMIMVTHDVDEAIYLSEKVIVMSPRPGRIMEIIPIELEHPRGRTDDQFLAYRKQIMDLLHVEAM